MKLSIKKGFNFGLTSGIITTLGLIIGLNSGTHSRMVVIAGILTIAIADALSDSLGVHMSEESGSRKTTDKEVWEITISTFFSKLFFALTFIFPFLFFDLNTAIILSVIWGFFLLTLSSYFIAKYKKSPAIKVITEHLTISIIVIIITRYIGSVIFSIFGNFL